MLPLSNAPRPSDATVVFEDEEFDPKAEEQKLREEFLQVQTDMIALRDDWVRHRAQSGVEDRWLKAQRLYQSEDGVTESALVDTLKNGPATRKKTQPRSMVDVNIVRPKVDQAVARMCEILLPVDDKNWGIKPTPVPSAVQKMVGNSTITKIPGTEVETGMTANDEAQAVIQAAKESSKEMEKVIDDALTECQYNGEQRKGIADGILLGTMIMKGPYPFNQITKVWQPGADGVSELQINHQTVPASCRADPWDVWFDPACGNDHQRGQGVWHRRFVTRKELRGLVGVPGFNADALRDVLRQAPTRVAVAGGRVKRQLGRDRSYELWEYHGEIEPEMMAMCSYGTGDPLEDVDFGIVLMVNDHVVGAMESWIVDRSLPYDVWCWRKSDE